MTYLFVLRVLNRILYYLETLLYRNVNVYSCTPNRWINNSKPPARKTRSLVLENLILCFSRRCSLCDWNTSWGVIPRVCLSERTLLHSSDSLGNLHLYKWEEELWHIILNINNRISAFIGNAHGKVWLTQCWLINTTLFFCDQLTHS